MISITRRNFLKFVVNSILSAILGVKLSKSKQPKQVYTTWMPIVAGGQAKIPDTSDETVSDGTIVDDSFITFDDTMVFL